MKEKIEAIPEVKEEKEMIPEDEIVAEMINHIRQLKNGINNGSVIEHFHSEIENSYTSDLFEAYDSGDIPNLSILESSAIKASIAISKEIEDSIKNGVSEDDLLEEKAIERLLIGRPKIIMASISSYVSSVLSFQQLAIGRIPERELMKQIEQADHHRRQMHNSLIESLKVFTTTVENAKELDMLSDISVIQWQSPMVLNKLENNIVVFSNRALEDRHYIRDWAIVAEMHKRLAEIEELEKK